MFATILHDAISLMHYARAVSPVDRGLPLCCVKVGVVNSKSFVTRGAQDVMKIVAVLQKTDTKKTQHTIVSVLAQFHSSSITIIVTGNRRCNCYANVIYYDKTNTVRWRRK